MSLPEYAVRCVPRDVTYTEIKVGPVTLHVPPEGSILVEHRCHEWDDDERGEHVVVYAAPRLADAHIVDSLDPPTIRPSIACPGCGLHGYITAGEWRPV